MPVEVGSWSSASIDAAIGALTSQNVPSIRALRRRVSRDVRSSPGSDVLALALELHEGYLDASRFAHRIVAAEVLTHHPDALALVDASALARLGRGMSEWSHVDVFCTAVAGRAWRERQVPDSLIERWTWSPDRWWRRAALVATVPLNVPAQGGHGDAPRTLAVCLLLVDDRDDMVVKALSWALRVLAERDPGAVTAFLEAHDARLAARVRREVRYKLDTGVKQPARSRRTAS